MKTKTVVSLIALLGFALVAIAQTSSTFTYQGRLKIGGGDPEPSDLFDYRFTLFDVSTGGIPVTAGVGPSSVPVTNGLFTVPLDFGSNIFNGAPRWLEIEVRPATTNPAAPYQVLSPRQQITAAPQSFFAEMSGMAANISPNSSLNLTGPVQFNPASGPPFAVGNTQRVANLNADLLDGLNSSDLWKLGGNSGTAPGVNFLGTTDNQALELKVNGARALRLEPNANNEPSLIGGAPNNFIASGVRGATIAGGGSNLIETNADFAFVGSGSSNVIRHYDGQMSASVIGGGLGNIIIGKRSGAGDSRVDPAAYAATIAGGGLNLISSNSQYATIGGGAGNICRGEWGTVAGGRVNSILSSGAAIAGGNGNSIAPHSAGFSGANSLSAFIGAGEENHISGGNFGVIAGGLQNTQQRGWYGFIGGGTHNGIGVIWDTNSTSAAWYSAVVGGRSNVVASEYSSIGGGRANQIQEADYSVIAGGADNLISSNASHAAISGGSLNDIGTNSSYSFIGGGQNNSIADNSWYATIGGGFLNDIGTNSDQSVIGGGVQNNVGTYSGYATIGGGYLNDVGANSQYTSIGGGYDNNIGDNAAYATIPGGRAAKASNYGQFAHASGRFAQSGDAQTSAYILRGTTDDATQTEIFLDGVSRRMTLANNAAWTFEMMIVARSSTDEVAGYRQLGVVWNINGQLFFSPEPKETLFETIASWDAESTISMANDVFQVKVTGSAGKNVRWVASVRTVEVIN